MDLYFYTVLSCVIVSITTCFIMVLCLDYGVERETTEILNELVTSKYSPWKVDYSWSEDAKTLREMAVKSPEQINDEFILKHFKTLKIVDRGVIITSRSYYISASLLTAVTQAQPRRHLSRPRPAKLH